MREHYTVKNFSLNLPVDDPEVKSVPKLLQHLAQNLKDVGDIEVQDIVFHSEGIDDDGIPYFTVYYHLKGQSE